MKIYFAPLQGYTEDVYRRIHHEVFGGVDAYFTPFMRVEHGKVRSKDLRDIRREWNEGVPVVPQIIVGDAKEMELLIDIIKEQGYERIDINMGCPFPLQTKHGKGAGLLARPEKVREIMEVVKAHEEISFSVKMRLGLERKDEWREVVNLLNDAPLCHVTIHPRTAKMQYEGELLMDEFWEMVRALKHKVIYNGEIREGTPLPASPEGEESLRGESPLEGAEKGELAEKVVGVMIGRGLLARPSLAMEIREGKKMDERELLRRIRVMHDKMKEHYEKVIPGEAQRVNKLRTFWDYMEETIGRKSWKKIRKSGNYWKIIEEVL